MGDVTFDELSKAETKFLQFASPANSFSADEVLSAECCPCKCVYYIRRVDILNSRYLMMQSIDYIGIKDKRICRNLFLRTLKREKDGQVYTVSLLPDRPTCLLLLGRVFGVGLSTLLQSFSDQEVHNVRYRGWYSKTVDLMSSCLFFISEHVQFNSLDQVMLPPTFSARMPLRGSVPVSVSEIRKKFGLSIRERNIDSLTRCCICVGLNEDSKNPRNSDLEKKEVEHRLSAHFRHISIERSITKTLALQSNDPSVDLTLLLCDSMANKHSKLPLLVSRPKALPDGIRVTANISTVQVAETTGGNQYQNIVYPSLQGVFKHDSFYNLSILLDSMTKLKALPSTLVLILDSASNNKSFKTLGGLGVILSKVKKLQRIYILHPMVGHTHNSVDSHFGNLSQLLCKLDIKDPMGINLIFVLETLFLELDMALESFSCVDQVNSLFTVYDFEDVQNHVKKPANLMSNFQFLLTKDSTNKIFWSSTETMHAEMLFSKSSNCDHFELFDSNFKPEEFIVTIKKPSPEGFRSNVNALFAAAQSLLTDQHKANYFRCIDKYGKKSFRKVIAELNLLPSKTGITANSTNFSHKTILEFLNYKGYPVGKIPHPPVV